MFFWLYLSALLVQFLLQTFVPFLAKIWGGTCSPCPPQFRRPWCANKSITLNQGFQRGQKMAKTVPKIVKPTDTLNRHLRVSFFFYCDMRCLKPSFCDLPTESEMITLSRQFCASLHVGHARRSWPVLNYRISSGSLHLIN